MSTADRTQGYAKGLFEIARAEGQLDRVRDELVAIARAFETSPDLRDTLLQPSLPSDRKTAIVNDLIGGRASDLTVSIVGFITASGNASSLPSIVDALVEEAASAINREVAEIRTAVDLDDETVAKLVTGLERATGKQLTPKVVVDPTIMGGIVARVGDRVIDGSIQQRLAGLRQAMKTR